MGRALLLEEQTHVEEMSLVVAAAVVAAVFVPLVVVVCWILG